MNKLMVVPVGTSLFHSASWEKDNEEFQNELGTNYYRHYADFWAINQPDKGLHAPDYRKKNDGGLDERFKNLLTLENTERWSEWLAEYIPGETPVMRFSAELATIFNFARTLNGRQWQKKLEEYTIVFIHDDHENEASHIAAAHLRAYLHKISPSASITTKPISCYSSTCGQDLLNGVREYYSFLARAITPQNDLGKAFSKVDIITSGGYKIYNIASSRMLYKKNYRIIYQHELSNEVIIQAGNSYRINNTDFSVPPIG